MTSAIIQPSARDIENLLYQLSRKRGWDLRLLGSGASSVAWQAEFGNEHWIIRAMPAESAKPMSYPQEFAVSKRLFQAGFPVPEPLQHSAETALEGLDFAWTISRKAEGAGINKANLSDEAGEDLARMLAFLHALPAEGWGWLHLKQGRFVGEKATPLDGARERWQAHPLWPLDKSRLESHPASYNAPFFLPSLKRLMPELMRAASLGTRAVCHSDLHREHLYIKEGRLSAVIDFGDVCLLPPAWEFAILARYYGWPAVLKMLRVYAPNNVEGLLRQALALGMIVAMYKFNRRYQSQAAVILRAQELYFLQQTLDHWQGRPIEK